MYRSLRRLGKTCDYINGMAILLRNPYFSGKDSILMLDVLDRFVREAEILKVIERQACAFLPYFSRGIVEDPFLSFQTHSTASAGGLTLWTKAVKYLLGSCATNVTILSTISTLQDICQRSEELETDWLAQ